jgi:hypothetical protein
VLASMMVMVVAVSRFVAAAVNRSPILPLT